MEPSSISIEPLNDSTSIVPPMALSTPNAVWVILPVASMVMLPPTAPLSRLAVTEAFSSKSPMTFRNTLVPMAELIGASITRPPEGASTVIKKLPRPALPLRLLTAASMRLLAAPTALPAVRTRLTPVRSISGAVSTSSAGVSPSMMLPMTAVIVILPEPASTDSSVTLPPARITTLAPALSMTTELVASLCDITMSAPASIRTSLPTPLIEIVMSAFCKTLRPAKMLILPLPLTTSALMLASLPLPSALIRIEPLPLALTAMPLVLPSSSVMLPPLATSTMAPLPPLVITSA